MNLLSVKKLSLFHQGVSLLEDVNFEIDEVGLTFVLGPNGAGKSLLLRQLHLKDEACKGDIEWGENAATHGRRFIFQKPILLNRTVLQNMRFVAKRLKLTEDHIQDQLKRVGLQDKCQQQAAHLSGGEKQKLVFARESLGNPKALLLDEPTANLDPQATLEIENLTLNFLKTKGSVILASHDLHQIRRLASGTQSRVLFINKGKLIFTGLTADFFQSEHSGSHSAPIRLFLTGTN